MSELIDSSPSTRNYRSDILFTIGLLLLLWLLWAAREILMLIYVSALFAVVLSPAIEAVRKIHLGYWWPGRAVAILLILGGVVASFTLFLIYALPPIFHDLQSFGATFPNKSNVFIDRIHRIPFLSGLDLAELEQSFSNAMGGALGLFKGLAGGLFTLSSWIVLTAYFVLDGERAFYWFLSFFQEPQRGRVRFIMLRAEKRIRHWLVGQAILMLILGVSSGIAYWALNLKYTFALAVLAGALNIVPIVGPLTAFAFAALVAAFDSWTKLAGVCGFYFIFHQLDNAVLTPRVMKYSVDLPPLAVIVALSVGATLAGVVGALIAVPTAAVIAVLADEFLVRFRPSNSIRPREQSRSAVSGID